MSDRPDPFQQLLDLANRSRSSVSGLPSQLKVQPHWSGIGFKTGGHLMVAPMGEVIEILAVPPSTRLPRVRSWVRGLANVRGRLLPLIDLEGFWGGQLSSNRRRHRVLVFDMEEFLCGLIVDEVTGMEHFPIDTYVADSPSVGQRRLPYVDGSYVSSKGNWALFRVNTLLEDPDFLDTAI